MMTFDLLLQEKCDDTRFQSIPLNVRVTLTISDGSKYQQVLTFFLLAPHPLSSLPFFLQPLETCGQWVLNEGVMFLFGQLICCFLDL